MSDWAIATLPLLGVAFGAALQFWFSRAAEREKHAESLRAQAYTDYLRAVAASAHLRSDEDLRDAHRNAADAKSRIAVYGTAEVVKALARFEETGAVLHGEGPQAAFVALVSSMRAPGEGVTRRDLELLLLGPDDRPSQLK